MKKINFTIYLFTIFILYFTSNTLQAYPKFAALYGKKCMNCHVSPTGGGLRHMGGVGFSKEQLYMKIFEKWNKTMQIDPMINKSIQIGADMRTLFFADKNDAQYGTVVPYANSFYEMQADLYVNAKINDHLNLLLNPSLQYQTFNPIYEVYGMVSDLPAGLYIRAGKMRPNFGIRIPEHRAYQRFYNLNTPYYSDAGIEAGISPGLFTLNVGVFNGVNNSYNDFDSDPGKEIVASGDIRWASKKNIFTFNLGGSFLNNPYRYANQFNNKFDAVRQIGAAFFSIGLMERIAVLGEFDYNKLNVNDTMSTKQNFHTVFGEADITLIQGIEAKFQYENYDPELGMTDQSLVRNRYSFGVELFPFTGLELESIYRVVTTPAGTALHENEFQQTFKFYF